MSPPSEPYLELVLPRRAERLPARLFVPEGRLLVGRGEDAGLRLRHASVSRSHCIIERRGRRVIVRDLKSQNGTWLGAERVTVAELQDGDVLRVGRVSLLVRLPAARAATPPDRAGRGRDTVPRRRASAGDPHRLRRGPHLAVAAAGLLIAAGISAAVITVGGREGGEASGAVATDDAAVAATADDGTRAAGDLGATGADERSAEPAEVASDRGFPPDIRPVEPPASELSGEPAPASPASSVVHGGPAPPNEREESVVAVPLADASAEPVGAAAHLTTQGPEAELREPVPDPAGAGESVEAAAIAPASSFAAHLRPFLARHCIACHRDGKAKGDLSLERFHDAEAARKERDVWEAVALKLRKREMPPANRPQPPPDEIDFVVRWIDRELLTAGPAGTIDPGRVTLRRLNAYEYNYTTRDLLGVDLKLGDGFPADDVGYGFDNIGDVLSLPPLLMEKYLDAAGELVKAVLADRRARERIVTCEPQRRSDLERCAREVLQSFASRAYRRPATAGEVERLVGLVRLALRSGGDFEEGIGVAMQAVLASPHFIFRVELDAEPNDPRAVRPLNDFELASRLSYFLWSSMPDDELFDLARAGKLREPSTIEAQARRMILDRRARGLVKTFSGLWLGSRAMKEVSPDPRLYPSFNERLRADMRKETELFFQEVMQNDLSVLLFLDSDFTFLNDRLAEHYGIAGVEGGEHRRVKLDDPRRGGVLTQGTFLTVTSNPTRTSPVKRGRWILEQILGAPPPPPLPGQDSLEKDGEEVAGATLRERLEKHRRDPECASCHAAMDPLGFALENYDAVGSWREKDGPEPIDPAANLPGGRTFRGPAELKRLLLERKGDFVRCLAEKMLTFALGRGLEYTDRAAVDGIVQAVEDGEHRFSSLVLAIVRSPPFQMRRGDG